VNDLIRDKLMNRKGIVSLHSQIFAGSCAGFLNVFFTNPVEAIKIRIQVAGQFDHKVKTSAVKIIKKLGFSGLYRVRQICPEFDLILCVHDSFKNFIKLNTILKMFCRALVHAV